MKLPALICRLAVDFPHFGQTSMGSAEIFWTSSHWFPQSEQAYSYVGIPLARYARAAQLSMEGVNNRALTRFLAEVLA